jgi:hypothetical protein
VVVVMMALVETYRIQWPTRKRRNSIHVEVDS